MASKVMEVMESKSKNLPLPEKELLYLYEMMVINRHLDERCIKLQRSGRINFYVPQLGQEAAQIGSAYALGANDWVAPAYREPGAALIRGVTVQELVDQYFGNRDDLSKGRQMPNHYAFKKNNYLSISSPIGTQIIHAAGLAMAFRIKKQNNVAITYFGDGATSSNDFHTGMTFAGVYKSPVIFFCNNNGWAISLPREQQCAAETLADKAIGYGMPGVRCDGNDVLAVYMTTREAVDRARSGEGPTFVEAITYRMGPHSTSDDPKRYRDDKEVDEWQKKDPLERYKAFLLRHKLMDQKTHDELWQKATDLVGDAIRKAETTEKPDSQTLFDDVYSDEPWHIREQRQWLEEEEQQHED